MPIYRMPLYTTDSERNKETMDFNKDKSDIESVRHIDFSTLFSLSLKTENNLVSFNVVYVDAQLMTSDDCQLLLSDLQKTIGNDVKYYYDINESLKSIEAEDSKMMKIFLIMSGALAHDYGNHFSKISHIECIYIFCHDQPKYEKSLDRIEKIRGIYQDKTQLLIRLTCDIKELTNRWSFIEESSFENESTDESRWHHLFIKILLSLSSTKEALQDLIRESKLFYERNTVMKKKIEEFEKSYKSFKAIDYYTEDNFVYRIVNYALRTKNIDIIIKFRAFITDLHKELQKIYRKYIYDIREKKLLPTRIVYRGQYCRINELDHLKNICRRRNPSILLTMFGSATHDPVQALSFIPDIRPGYIACLYEIIIPDDYHTSCGKYTFAHPFADLYKFGKSPGEKEVLFDVGTCFYLKYISNMTTEIPSVIIVLELVNNRSAFGYNWSGIDQKLCEESDEAKDDLLALLRKHTTDMKKINWKKWWNQLERQWGSRTTTDESLAVTMYECFDDSQSKIKAIELRKRALICDQDFKSLSLQDRLCCIHKHLKSTKSTRIIALYELFLRSDVNDKQLVDNRNELIDVLQSAGDAYKKLGIETEYTLKCYQQALQFEDEINPQSKRLKCLQNKICNLTSKALSTKTDFQLIKKNNDLLQLNLQRIEINDYEYDSEQWSTFWYYRQLIRGGSKMENRAEIRITYLHEYLKKREHWIDSRFSKFAFRMPFGHVKEDKLSIIDCRLLMCNALKSYFDERNWTTADRILYLWRYEKFMIEWLSLNDVDRIIQTYVIRYLDATALLHTIDRLIKKIGLIVVFYTVLLSVQKVEETDHPIVDVNQFELLKIANIKVPKLVFYDDRNNDFQDEVNALKTRCSD